MNVVQTAVSWTAALFYFWSAFRYVRVGNKLVRNWLVAGHISAGIWSFSIGGLFLTRHAIWHRLDRSAALMVCIIIWYGFARYVNPKSWLRRPKTLVFLGLSAVLQAMIWLLPAQYITSTKTPFFWLVILWAYGLITAALFLVFRSGQSVIPEYRHRFWLMAAAFIIPLLATIVANSGLLRPLNLMPFSFLMSSLLLTVVAARAITRGVPLVRSQAIEEVHDLMLAISEQGQLIDFNHSAQQLFAIKEENLGQSLLKLVAEVPLPMYLTAQELIVESSARTGVYDISITPLAGRGYLLLLRDITTRKEAESQLRQANERLQEEIRQREQLIADLNGFAHMVAHDLKNPLGVILGFSQILAGELEKQYGDEWQFWTTPINEMSRKMNTIIDEMLLLAKVRQQDVVVTPLNMTLILAEVNGRLHHLIEEYNVQISYPAEWPKALGHPSWVEEVWVNYISNAIKYGGRPPLIALGATPQPDGMVCFWVKDNGDGVATAVQSQLFDSFTRFSNHQDGHGVGLSIVKRIVEKLGGHVCVESSGQPGQGATFCFTLPAVADSDDGMMGG